MPKTEITLAGEVFVADLSGALFHPASGTLVVADLHFEKGSFFATRRQMLPPYDTAASLAKLNRAIARYAPNRLIALGDSFHDLRAGERLSLDDAKAILALGHGRDLIWITGNHDSELPSGLPGDRMDEMMLGSITLLHQPTTLARAEIAGHLHPVARVATSGGLLRRRCFAQSADKLILPAFGAYTGGLNIRDPAFMSVFHGIVPRAYVLGDTKVFSVPAARTRPD